jgi:hypothetical protein
MDRICYAQLPLALTAPGSYCCHIAVSYDRPTMLSHCSYTNVTLYESTRRCVSGLAAPACYMQASLTLFYHKISININAQHL